MSLRNMLHDRVTLVKQDGRRFEDVSASVQSGQIFTDDPKLPIEEGDTFERKLPSGLLETFVVTDRGFMEGSAGIPSHYQSKVRKSAGIDSEEGSQMAKLKLFVSHSSADLRIVTLLVDLLRSALKLSATEIRCTSVDGYRLPGGADTLKQLRREVHDAQAFIGVISTASIESIYVMFELGARWGAEKHLLPVLAPGTNRSILSGPLSGINALVCDNRAQLHQLVDDVARELAVQAEPSAAIQKEIDRLLEAGAALRTLAPDIGKTAPGASTAYSQSSEMPETWSPDSRNFAWVSALDDPELFGIANSLLAVRQACHEDSWRIKSSPGQVWSPQQSECRMYSAAVKNLQKRYPKDFPLQPLDDDEGYATNPSPGWLLSLCDAALTFIKRKHASNTA